MNIIDFEDGLVGYRLNGGGVLRFNPADPNIYSRFLQLGDKLEQVQQELSGSSDALWQLTQADQKIKALLGWVFGGHNDFDALLGGVNLLAMAGNGQRVLINLLDALEPIMRQGAEQCARDLAASAVAQARQRRDGQC